MGKKGIILVIDDDPSVRRLLTSHLTSLGYGVEAVPDGETGIKKAKSLKPDLIILDLLLPGIDGFQVCQKIRAEESLSSVHIVMLTAIYLSEEDRIAGFRVGTNGYIVKPDVFLSKPVHLAELAETVDKVISGKRDALPPPPGPDRILIVDDDESNLRLLTMRLASEGFDVDSAMTGAEALDKMMTFEPQIILLDIQMPVMSGIDVLNELKKKNVRVPVVMMTAYGSESVAVEAFAKGAADYLIKPFDSGSAARRIRRIIDGYRLKLSQEKLTERLKKISFDLLNRVSHLERQNERLEEAYSTVRGLSEFNQRFIKSLNAELRAPLSMILSFASLLRDTPREQMDPESEAECLASIFATAFRLEIRLSNLIYLSRIQAGALEPVTGVFTLEPLVEEVLALVKKTLARDFIKVAWFPQEAVHEVEGDSAIFRDILTNVLDSAVHRIEGPGEIKLELVVGKHGKGDECLLKICDDGRLFTEADVLEVDLQDTTFEFLQQGSENLRMNLCRHLSALLGWSFGISNRPTGGGEISLALPGSRQ